jgi:hypothetical protein
MLPPVSGPPSPYSTLFADLYTKFTKQPAQAQSTEPAPEVLASGVKDFALLLPANPAIQEGVGTAAAADGTAWLIAPAAGDYVLLSGGRTSNIHLNAGEVKKP